eukprot:TRINITY_DN15171_c0_g1_i1.p1 TRINITY_DN15171_c0_g1~~TRINITY_DN15171_c0_g1_i1.p1  ORF type:complete len:329 (+),score=34.97 TRINITY_DN15171_c0_g1_i1:105-1091(+)
MTIPSSQAEITTYEDDVGAIVTRCDLPDDWIGVFSTITATVENYSKNWYFQKTGVFPLDKKSIIKHKEDAIRTLKASMKETMRQLSQSYLEVNFNADEGYHSEQSRLGYVLKYTTFNACSAAVTLLHYKDDLVPHIAAEGGTLTSLLFGSGPATDWLAVKTFCDHVKLQLTSTVVDLPVWETLWTSDNPICSFDDRVTFVPLDILSEASISQPLPDPSNPPMLVTLFYTANEMVKKSEMFLLFFENLLSVLPTGASIVILDRTRAAILSFLKMLSTKFNDLIETVVLSDRFECGLPTQLINDVANYASKFGIKPRLSGKVGVTIFRKR